MPETNVVQEGHLAMTTDFNVDTARQPTSTGPGRVASPGVPNSPAPPNGSDEDSPTIIPPSLVLLHPSSVRFKPSLASRKNWPEDNSLDRLTSSDQSNTGKIYRRKAHAVNVSDDVKDKMETHSLGAAHRDENVVPARFRFTSLQLASLLQPKGLTSLEALGGIDEIIRGLGTDIEHGLRLDGMALTSTLDDRRNVFGDNSLPDRPVRRALHVIRSNMKDNVLIFVVVADIASLAVGLVQAFGTPREPGKAPAVWLNSVAIMVAVVAVVLVASILDYQKELQLRRLDKEVQERGVTTVIRGGRRQVVDARDLVVGDIALVEPGKDIPFDGIYISGDNMKCNEPGHGCDFGTIKKISYRECLDLRTKCLTVGTTESANADCFVISGSRVSEGAGKCVIVAVGPRSVLGTMMTASTDRPLPSNTPRQRKLNELSEFLAKVGVALGVVLFIVLMIRFFVQVGSAPPARTPVQNGITFVNILVTSLVLIVVAAPKGLPLAGISALIFATKRMSRKKLFVSARSRASRANTPIASVEATGTLSENDGLSIPGSAGIPVEVAEGDPTRPINYSGFSTSILAEMMKCRRVNDPVRKFLQFQLTAGISAAIIAFITAVASKKHVSVLSCVHLLWISIIIDPFAAFALATDPPIGTLPAYSESLFTMDMYKMIFIQSAYQIATTLVLHFSGGHILGLDHSEDDNKLLRTVVFNFFIFTQIFNSVNCRRLDRKLNILEGILNNWSFSIITLIEIGIQVLIICATHEACQVVPLHAREWAISITLGSGSLLVGILCRLIPNEPLERLFRVKPPLPIHNDVTEAGCKTHTQKKISFFPYIRGSCINCAFFIPWASRQSEEPLAPVSETAPEIDVPNRRAVLRYPNKRPRRICCFGSTSPLRRAAEHYHGGRAESHKALT